MALGAAPSFAIGGLITSRTHSPLTVFYIGAGILAVMTVIFGLTVDETFGVERRAERKKEREIELERARERERERGLNVRNQSRIRRSLRRAWSSISAPFHLITRVLPTRDLVTGKRNYRLFVLSLSFFLGSFVGKYVQGIVVLSTTKFHFAAKEVSLWRYALNALPINVFRMVS